MKELFETIITRLTATVTELKEIDFDMGQLNLLDMDQRPPVLFPCALLDISYPLCDDQDETTQLVTARINVRLAFECPLPTDSRASAARRTAALALFAVVDKVYKNLQGYDTAYFGAFSRKSQTPDNRYAGIKIMNMVFETNFIDETA
jgi:hypothetical protein